MAVAVAGAMALARGPSLLRLQAKSDFLGSKFGSEAFVLRGPGNAGAREGNFPGGVRVVAMAKKGSKKAGGGGGGGSAQKSSGSRGGGAGVAEKGTPYENETRRIILSLRNMRKVARSL